MAGVATVCASNHNRGSALMANIFGPGDPPELRRQLEDLVERGFSVRRPSPWHVKVGPVNFFPTTGRVTTDPNIKHEQRGFDYFLKVINKLQRQNAADTDQEIRIALRD